MSGDVQKLFALHYLGLVRLAMRLVGVDDPLRYLRGAVVNRSRSVLRRRLVERAFWARRERCEPFEAADAATLRQSDRQPMLRAIRGLPQRQREVVVLRYYEDLAVAQIATTLGISPGAVSSALNRAMAALSSKMEDHRVV